MGALKGVLRQQRPRRPKSSSVQVGLTLPSALDDVEVGDRARSRGLLVGAGRPYYVAEPPGPRLRLSFSAADQAQLSAGVRLLAETLHQDAP